LLTKRNKKNNLMKIKKGDFWIMEENEMVTINQQVSKDVYKKIKIIAVNEEKQIRTVISDALEFYAKSKIIK